VVTALIIAVVGFVFIRRICKEMTNDAVKNDVNNDDGLILPRVEYTEMTDVHAEQGDANYFVVGDGTTSILDHEGDHGDGLVMF